MTGRVFSPLAARRSAGRGRGGRLDDPGFDGPDLPRRRRAARSWSTSGTAGGRSPRPWRPRRPASRTRTGAPSRPSRSRPTRREVAEVLPVDDPAIYPVSGGSEAIETALKLARAYHLARGESDRTVVISRWGSYHGNTLGALDLSGRPPLRRPYEPWLGRFRHVSAAYPYRADDPGATALGDGAALAAELERAIAGRRPRHGRGLRRRADRRCHAGRRGPTRRLLAGDRGGLPPPRGPADRRRGDDRVRADRALVRARPLGRAAGPARRGQGGDQRLLAVRVRRGARRRSTRRSRRRAPDSPTGSPTRTARSRRPWRARSCGSCDEESLVDASARQGDRLQDGLRERLGDHPAVGRDPRPRADGRPGAGRGPADPPAVPARRARHGGDRGGRARARASCVYSGTGNADGTNGDTILLGPPFVVTDDGARDHRRRRRAAVESATASVRGAGAVSRAG